MRAILLQHDSLCRKYNDPFGFCTPQYSYSFHKTWIHFMCPWTGAACHKNDYKDRNFIKATASVFLDYNNVPLEWER